MKTIKDLLQEHPFFSDLSEEMLETVAGCGENKHFGPQDFLGKEGQPADYFFVVRSGKIAVQMKHPIKGDLTIRTLGPGEIGGISWIIPPYRLQFDLKALDNTSVISLDGECLRRKCEQDYKMGYLMMQQSAAILEKRLQNTRIQLLDVYSSRV